MTQREAGASGFLDAQRAARIANTAVPNRSDDKRATLPGPVMTANGRGTHAANAVQASHRRAKPDRSGHRSDPETPSTPHSTADRGPVADGDPAGSASRSSAPHSVAPTSAASNPGTHSSGTRDAESAPPGHGHAPIQRVPSVPGGVFVGERFPDLTVATPRLHVRPHTPADADRVTEIFGDRLTKRWLPFSAEYGPIDGRAWCGEMAAERRAMGQGDHYAIVRREDDRLIGCLWTKRTDWPARSTEVSYALAPEARGFGFAAEAVDGLVIELIMRHHFGRVEMRVAPGNTGSRRVAEKAGFRYEGLLRNAGYVHSGRVDLEMWSLVTGDLH